MRKVYGIGETVFDIIFRNDQPQRAVPGGSCFNSLISLGRCGLHPTMVTETGDDHVGQLIVDFMKSNGVDTDFVTIHPGSKTHISLAFLDENNDAHYQFYKDHASANVDSLFPDFQADDIVMFGSFFAINPVIRPYTRDFLQRAHDAGSILYYDINFRAAHIADLPSTISNIEENMRLATIVRGSTEDFSCLFGLTDPDAIYQHVAPLCPRLIITDGGGTITTFFGLSATEHKETTNAPQEGPKTLVQHFDVAPIRTVSTIGAGDNFNAGVVYHINNARLTRTELLTPTTETVADLVASGQHFSAEVCQSLDNYIPYDFAQRLLVHEVFCRRAFLFDLDGVIIDTEGQYQKFWGAIGREFLPHIPDFATRIKGSTLTAIHETYFTDSQIRCIIDKRLDAFEETMRYELFDGALDLVDEARRRGILCAIVTSSNQQKMASLAQQLPLLTQHFDNVFTAEDAGRGKPYPDCYIRAAHHYGLEPKECVVFEDSINGLHAAHDSQSFVVGVTTTHPLSTVRPLSNLTLGTIAELSTLLH